MRASRDEEDRKMLCGILLVPYAGIRWEFLPQELGFGSGMTCWTSPARRSAPAISAR
ncbi:hypothetical protein [Streptomyces sp. NPDC058614]|uniref:hypothetical protein n=1 Tax=Streptomyces sp. NPDC058614 TaxID=3346557 RepID=UPI003649121A